MSQSIQELIEKARVSGDWDPVTDWCEAFEWPEAVGLPPAEFYLKCIVAACPDDKAQLIEAVSAARAAGTPWSRIAEILNTTPQAVQDHYTPLIETAEPARR